MNNVIKFPGPGKSEALDRRNVGRASRSGADTHAARLDDEAFLFDTVGQFLAAGLLAGDGVLVIASEHHREAIERRLVDLDVQGAIQNGRLLFVDAHETLAHLMVDGIPDARRFREVLDDLLTHVRSDVDRPARVRHVRAYGEMDDILWCGGNTSAAVRLGELWSDAGKEHDLTLLCADARLREIARLTHRARSLEHEIELRQDLERALRAALEDGRRSAEALRASLKRETDARAKAEETDAFKEVFLSMLGHDLRNPLNTVLTTARLMAIRGELPVESRKRLGRIVSSGERMQRMIEQILDVTQARLASGIKVQPVAQDLVPIVARIVDDVSAAHPHRDIDFLSDGPCTVSVDAERFEQVISNLLGNAVVHGDPAMPIRVEISARETVVSFAVQNHGPPIAPALVPHLFDPFEREKPGGRSDGLGLGLYISERIVNAHSGTIGVASSASDGTRFEVMLPRQ